MKELVPEFSSLTFNATYSPQERDIREPTRPHAITELLRSQTALLDVALPARYAKIAGRMSAAQRQWDFMVDVSFEPFGGT